MVQRGVLWDTVKGAGGILEVDGWALSEHCSDCVSKMRHDPPPRAASFHSCAQKTVLAWVGSKYGDLSN